MVDPAQAFSSAFNSSFSQSRSLAERQQALAQDQTQFDITQHLKQQQADIENQKSMAQIAAINADQQISQIKLQQYKRQVDQAPLQQQAGVDFQNVINDATAKSQTPQDFDSMIQQGTANNPDIVRYFPGGITGYNDSVLKAKQAFMGTALQQLQVKKQLADQQTLYDAQSLGLDPSQFTTATDDGSPGPLDMGSLRAAVTDAQTQKEQAAATFKSELEGKRQQENIQARNQGAIDVVNQRLQANTARIKSAQQRVQYQAAAKNAQDAYKAMNKETPGSDAYEAAHDEYVKQLGIADGIFSDSTNQDSGLSDYVQNFLNNNPPASSNAAPTTTGTIAVNKLTGKKLQLINGQWQPIP